MIFTYTPHTIKLEQVQLISRGDAQKAARYLNQFLQLVPARLTALDTALKGSDRLGIRKVLHSMIPQLQFFGLDDIIGPIRQLEHTYNDIPWDQMEAMIQNIRQVLNRACEDVEEALKSLS